MNGVVNHLWQSTLFALAATAVAWALRGHSARIRYWIWLAASVKFLVPFSWLVLAGSQVDTPVAIAVPTFIEAATPLAPVIEPVAAEHPLNLPLIGLVVWALGSCLLLARWILGWRSLSAAKLAGRPVAMDMPVPVVVTPAPVEPGIFGIFRPVLLLPERLQLTAEEMDAIVTHELCHVRHRDNLTSALQMAVETAFWFHPLVWCIGRKLMEERERACDEAVMARGLAPETYARGILTVCRTCIESPVACASGVTGADLKKRIEEIMTSKMAKSLGMPAKVTLIAAVLATIVLPLFIGSTARAQSEKFEVASIRPGNPAIGRIGIRFTPGGGVQADNVTLRFLAMIAYDLQPHQVSGGAGWTDNDRFQVTAKPADGSTGASEAEDRRRARLRLQQLLAERFHLQVRRESKEAQGYALVVAKSGSKLQESAAASQGIRQTGHGEIAGTGVGMDLLTAVTAQQTGRAVVDKTGLTGRYDFTLRWAASPAGAVEPSLTKPGGGAAPADAGDANGPSLFTALQEQLGLRLEPQKVTVESIVILSADKPTEN